MKRYLLITLAIFSTLAFSGCGGPSPAPDTSQPVHLCVVIGGRQCNSGVTTAAEELEATLQDVATIPDSTVAIISVEGVPRVRYRKTFDAIPADRSKSKQAQLLEERIASVKREVLSTFAESPQADTLGAIRMGCRELQCYKNGSQILLIFDNGLSTVEPLNFTSRSITSDAETTTTELKGANELPDARTCDIHWYNLGDCRSPQEDLTESSKENLKKIWKAILTASHADSITFHNDLPSNKTYSDKLPKVSTVQVSTSDESMPDRVTIPITKLGFEANSAQLKDRAAAKQVLTDIANLISSNAAEDSYLIVGTTSHFGPLDSSLSLSYSRGSVMKDLLTELGVKDSQISVIGTAYLSPFYVDDGGPEQLREADAERNRCCILVKENSDDGKALFADEDYSLFKKSE